MELKEKVSSRRIFLATASSLGTLSIATPIFFITKTRNAESQNLETNSTTTSSALCSNRNIIGTGLLGEYFSKPAFNGERILARTDKYINSNQLQLHSGTKSVRWSGWVKFPLAGPHRFHFDHPNARISVSNKDFSLKRERVNEILESTIGGFCSMTIEISIIEKNNSEFKLGWTPPHGYRYQISTSMLFPPMS